MAQLPKILGVKKVLGNLERNKVQLGLRLGLGLRLAGLRLQRASMLVVPVDTGNLRASAFTRSKGIGYATRVTVGYTASYAMFVHEAVGMVLKGQARKGKGHKGSYWDPQGRAQAKFLEEPARRMRPELRAIVRKFTHI